MTDCLTAGVALVGCGTVGGSVARLLLTDAERLAARSGVRVTLRHVIEPDRPRALDAGVPAELLRSDLTEALADAETQIVVELVGGTTVAKEIVARSLRADKHVVTANKALLAHHGAELYALARARGVCIAIEASCVGGVPVIGSLLTGLLANEIEAMYGIVNGTCNYILSRMTEHGVPYAGVLAEAQAAGLAEADPTLDVTGVDSAHKLAILAALAFGMKIDFDAIDVEGIDHLDVADIRYGAELGYTVKLLAIAHRQAAGISLRVHPAFMHSDHPLARVRGPFNAVSIYGHATGHTLYYGRGAGGMPTASAVVADIVAVALGNAPRLFATLGVWPDLAAPAHQLPIHQIHSRYYLRVTCQDSPGVLAKITDVLGRHHISIASVLQHEPPSGRANGVPVVIATYEAVEGDMEKALGEVDTLAEIKAPTVCIRIVDEHEEPEV